MDAQSESGQKVRDAWVASFEILNLQSWAALDADPREAGLTQNSYAKLAEIFRQTFRAAEQDSIACVWLPDRFVIYTNDSQGKSYSLIQRSAKAFFEKCLTAGVPLRGALSVGPLVIGADNRMLTGKALVDTLVVATDQDWLGLLLTQEAAARIRSLGLKPEDHGFATSTDIPMREFRHPVMAYRYQNGIANFDSALIPALETLLQQAEDRHRALYQRTLDFVRKCYRHIGSTDHA